MDFEQLKKRGGRLFAAAGVATNLASVPVTKDGTPNLVKQYASYSRGVRLEEIGREIRRDTTKTFNAEMVLDKRVSKKLRNPK